jgi:MFS family permease
MPILLRNVESASASNFVLLFTLEGFCRGILMTIVPLRALELLGGAQEVSLLYLSTSVVGLVAAMAVPLLVHMMRRRFVLTAGAVSYVCACALFFVDTPASLICGLGLFVFGTAVHEVTLNLYVLDHIPRRELPRFEPKRMFFAALTFSAGPWLGVYLHFNVLENLTFGVAAASAALFCGYFWYLRLRDDPTIVAARRPPPSPLRYIRRYFAQPRLFLAWALAFGRNGWWLMFVVYTPIYVTQAGYSPQTGGAIVSLGILPMLLMPLWAKVSGRYGIRVLLIGGYLIAGSFSIFAGLISGEPLLAIVLLCCSAFGATVIDGAGNVPFLRAVHPYERGEMTSVFMTYRHGANLTTPGMFAIVLSFFALPSVFVIGGTCLFGMAALARFIPKRM